MVPTLEEKIRAIEEETGVVFGAHNSRMVAFVARIGQADRRLQAGDPAPDFAAPTSDGSLATLSSLMGPKGLVLVFIRGLWCPYCNAQMTSFEEQAAGFETSGLRVAVITPEVGGRAAETKTTLGLSAEVLCDVDEGIALSYGCLIPVPQEDRKFLIEVGYNLAELYGNDAWFMPLASTFLVRPDGVIAAVFGGADQRDRPAPDAVIQAAAALASGA